MKPVCFLAAAAPALLAAPALAQTGGPFDLTWNSIDAGGGASAGGAWELRGTIGQFDAGEMTGGPWSLSGGFWAGAGGAPCYPDCDTSSGPGVLDVFDLLCFQNRFDAMEPYACDCDTGTGPSVCDIFDFLCFQNAFTGGCP